MGDYNATVTDDGKVILSRKSATSPSLVTVEPIDPDGTEVVTPEMPAEPADDPKPRRGRASSDD
jgi:hypothetical protein